MGTVEIVQMFGGAPNPLRIAVREKGLTTELIVRGEWDLAQQPTVRSAIQTALQSHPECVLLDLSQLSFIDSSGIHNVLELQSRCVTQNAHLAIIPGSRAVQRPFEICRVAERLPFVESAA
jgi:anti-sigma B factor antagonist